MFFSSLKHYILHDWVVCNEIFVLAVRNTGQLNYSRARQRSHIEENPNSLPGPSPSSARELSLQLRHKEEGKLGGGSDGLQPSPTNQSSPDSFCREVRPTVLLCSTLIL